MYPMYLFISLADLHGLFALYRTQAREEEHSSRGLIMILGWSDSSVDEVLTAQA